jgi:hypothetical protein
VKTALESALRGPGAEIRVEKIILPLTNAGRISKDISGLKTTSALGPDGIPVAVLKMESDVLAGPISHMVNMLLSKFQKFPPKPRVNRVYLQGLFNGSLYMRAVLIILQAAIIVLPYSRSVF